MTHIEHITGHTYHGRKGLVQNQFRYSVDYVFVNACDPPAHIPMLFGWGRAGVMSLHKRDNGGAVGAGTGVAWVRDVLSKHAIAGVEHIWLLTQPRFLGHVFNPVSFWLCYDPGHRLIAVIAEVTNTYGDRHSYLCVKPGRGVIQPSDVIQAQKVMHVSPFQPVDGTYEFRFDISPKQVGVWINHTNAHGGVIATLTGRRQPVSNRSILWAALRRPLGSRRVLALIHWQALKLWWKGAVFRPRPQPPSKEVS